MSAVLLVFEFIILAGACLWLLRHYASFKRTPWYALASTWLGWLLCFSIVFLVPMDILNMDYNKCIDDNTPKTNTTDVVLDSSAATNSQNHTIEDCHRPFTSLPDSYMKRQWAVLWWGTMILSWLAFPLLSSFFQAGHFTVWERCVRAIKENIILYAVLGVIGIIAVLFLWKTAQMSRDAFLAFMLSLANAYGLVLTVVLMGYGLVDIPRYLWRKANRTETLRYYCVMAFKYKEGIETAKEDLLKTLKVVKSIADRVNDHDPYRPYVDVILSKCPSNFGDVSGDGDVELSYSKLVSVHQKVISDTHNVERAVCLYEQMLKKAFKTEDVIRTRTHKQSDWKVYWSFIPARTHRFARAADIWEYLWQVYLFTSILRIFAVFFAILSILIVWCEITLTSSKDLSPFYHMIERIPITGFAKQIFCLVVIFYMALCAYTTLFKIKIFNFYRLVPHQMSDGGSIMFSANYLCRLAAPLSYNFLSLINLRDTNFDAVMGSMATGGLGKDFNVGFPILVAVLCLFALFNVYSKIGSICCIKALRYRPDDDEALIGAGETILAEARENKEGKGAVQMSTKETIKSSIREEVKDVSKIAKNNSEDRLYEGETSIRIQEPPDSGAPATVYSTMAQKYGIQRGSGSGDLLPANSRFSRRKSIDPLSAAVTGINSGSGSGMKHNLSANDLADAETGSMPRNLSNNNLLPQPASSTSTFSKFLSIKPSTLSANTPATANTSTTRIASPAQTFTSSSTTTAPPPSLARPSSFSTSPSISSSSSKNYDSLLPSTSRFAQRPPAPATFTPSPASSAILSSSSSAADSDTSSLSSSGKPGDTKSLLGNLFGKPK